MLEKYPENRVGITTEVNGSLKCLNYCSTVYGSEVKVKVIT
jgi:hypothetical protein